MDNVEKAIEDAYDIAIQNDISQPSEVLKRHFKFMLKQIAVAAIESVQKEQNDYIFEIKKHLHK